MDQYSIVKRLCENGHKAFIVGGCVRDIFLDEESEDIDIATSAIPTEIERIFSDRKIKTVGKVFGVVLVDNFEVATFRNDQFYNIGDKNCNVTFTDTIEDDLARRDLTINSMALCELTGELVDPYNGQIDIKNRIIRFVGDPIERIMEDPNRIIRACRFLAKIEGKFEYNTLQILKENSFLINDHVSPERIHKEILKAMELNKPSLFFSALHVIGALRYIFPEMDNCINHPHGRFHKETIWEHIMLVGDSLPKKKSNLRLAGYLHDIGKPSTYLKNNDGSFINHENEGAEIVYNDLKRLKFSNDEIENITNLIKAHMFNCKDLTSKASRKLQKRINNLNINPKDWARLKIADRYSNMAKSKFEKDDIRNLILHLGIRRKEEECPFTVKDLLVSGQDIINLTKLSPGPTIGKIQKYLLEKVIENGPEANTHSSIIYNIQLYMEKNNV